ncbi:hypothetical protein GWI33_002383 [Rhynchophorus ferrugineus]|uniref:Mos1 transposase HTH domain-containing protein n=1 Tax=Rhynchophorus ferrugineus TaxID=354439 RepID=A0A834MHL4_RHYFE|nr:hypothetical protein GWI33_002383 [Rhynchophorus ferrugineus]
MESADTVRCEIRSVIRFLNAKKRKPIEIHRQLEEVYGKDCISVQHVRKWCKEFSEGRIDVHHEQRSGGHRCSTKSWRRLNAFSSTIGD